MRALLSLCPGSLSTIAFNSIGRGRIILMAEERQEQGQDIGGRTVAVGNGGDEPGIGSFRTAGSWGRRTGVARSVILAGLSQSGCCRYAGSARFFFSLLVQRQPALQRFLTGVVFVVYLHRRRALHIGVVRMPPVTVQHLVHAVDIVVL